MKSLRNSLRHRGRGWGIVPKDLTSKSQVMHMQMSSTLLLPPLGMVNDSISDRDQMK